jgi:hypothetical protein
MNRIAMNWMAEVYFLAVAGTFFLATTSIPALKQPIFLSNRYRGLFLEARSGYSVKLTSEKV